MYHYNWCKLSFFLRNVETTGESSYANWRISAYDMLVIIRHAFISTENTKFISGSFLLIHEVINFALPRGQAILNMAIYIWWCSACCGTVQLKWQLFCVVLWLMELGFCDVIPSTWIPFTWISLGAHEVFTNRKGSAEEFCVELLVFDYFQPPGTGALCFLRLFAMCLCGCWYHGLRVECKMPNSVKATKSPRLIIFWLTTWAVRNQSY